MTPIPIVLWCGEREWILSAEQLHRGELDDALLPMLRTSQVYREVLFNCAEFAGPEYTDLRRMVDRGCRLLSSRLLETATDPVEAALEICKTRLAVRS
jgi:hypothetical protein